MLRFKELGMLNQTNVRTQIFTIGHGSNGGNECPAAFDDNAVGAYNLKARRLLVVLDFLFSE